jgi:hypothetical protein
VAIPADALLRLTGRFSADDGGGAGAKRFATDGRRMLGGGSPFGPPHAGSGRQEAVGPFDVRAADSPNFNPDFADHPLGAGRGGFDFSSMASGPTYYSPQGGQMMDQAFLDPQGYPYAIPVDQPEGGAGGRYYAQQGMVAPGYETLKQISQQHQDTPANRDIVIPPRYQEGGVIDLTPAGELTPEHEFPHSLMHPRPMHTQVARRNLSMPPPQSVATDATGNPPWAPVRGGSPGMEATAPENEYQGGGVIGGGYPELHNARQLMAYQQAMSAMRPQMARPIYTGQMLMRPPQQLSGYAGELGGYQEGGEVDPKTGKVERNYATEGAGAYYYADPRARGSLVGSRPIQIRGENILDWTDNPAGYVPEGQNPYSFQGGGVVYPGGMAVDQQTGLPTLGGVQAPRQQASPAAGEPSKKKQAPAQGPQKYQFGPPGMYSAPAMLMALKQQEAEEAAQAAKGAQGMKEGGVIPKEFMQYLANGGLVKDFGPDHQLMFALGMKYALSPKQAAKRLGNSANLMPP